MACQSLSDASTDRASVKSVVKSSKYNSLTNSRNSCIYCASDGSDSNYSLVQEFEVNKDVDITVNLENLCDIHRKLSEERQNVTHNGLQKRLHDLEHYSNIDLQQCDNQLVNLDKDDHKDQTETDCDEPSQGDCSNTRTSDISTSFSQDYLEDELDQNIELNTTQMIKISNIESLLKNPIIDVLRLQELAAETDGFVTDAVRQQAWPRLLHTQDAAAIPILSRTEAAEHHCYKQVVLDVERTLKRFPPGISPGRRRQLMDQLIRIIVTVLTRNPDMHYYQGYHDVGITFLLVCGEEAAVLLLEELSLRHLREFLQPTMERTQRWLAFLYPILRSTAPALHRHMMQSGVGTVFCLAWLITWYAHTLSQYRQVVRLYDFLLASPPLMSMYVAAEMLRCKETQLLAVECDMAMMHHALSQVPEDLLLDELLEEARLLYRRLPPPTIAEEVDRYMEDRKKEEEAERVERQVRMRAAEERRAAAAIARLSWTRRALAAVTAPAIRRSATTGAAAVAVVAVVVGVTALLYKNYLAALT